MSEALARAADEGGVSFVPRVSCVITAYNVGPYIGAAVQSALDVDWPADRLEIVVVDDGSTDATPEILRGFGDRIRVITQDNQGFNAAMTVGLQAATGDYLTMLDGDDEWPRDRLKVLAGVLDARPEVGLVHGDMEIVDEHGDVLHPSFFEHDQIQLVRGWVLPALLCANFVSGGASLVRGELRERFLPIPPEAAFPDWYIATRVAEIAQIVDVPVPVNRYRRHDANMGLGATGTKLVDATLRHVEYIRWMLRELRLDGVTPDEMVTAYATMHRHLLNVAAWRRQPASTLVEVDDGMRARAAASHMRAREAFDGEDFDGAVRHAVRALAADPYDGGARADLDVFVALRGARPEAERPVRPTVRSTVVLAEAGELLAHPELLHAWRAHLGAGDDVTLLICIAPDEVAELGGPIQDLAVTAGLGDADAPDAALHTAADASAIGVPFAARLTAGAQDDLPAVGADGVEAFARRYGAARATA